MCVLPPLVAGCVMQYLPEQLHSMTQDVKVFHQSRNSLLVAQQGG